MKAATMATVYAKVRALGATVDRGDQRVNFDAPRGQVWVANQCHTLAYSWYRAYGPSSFLREMLDDLQYGLEPCEAPDCDLCTEEVR